MSRIVKCGLIQTSLAGSASDPIAAIRKANVDKTVVFVEQAGAAGVQILCMQEIFYWPLLLRRAESALVRGGENASPTARP
jgi:beta-ureidopropionase